MAPKTKKNSTEVEDSSLVQEIITNRKELYESLEKVVVLRNMIDKIFPQNNTDIRNRHVLEAKMKTITEVVKAELSLRQQIDASVKNELDVKKKIKDLDKEDAGEFSIENIMKMAQSMTDSPKDLEEESEG